MKVEINKEAVFILIVSPDYTLSSELCKAFILDGYSNVKSACDGNQALEVIRTPFGRNVNETAMMLDKAVILSEEKLSDLDGVELCKNIKSEYENALTVLLSEVINSDIIIDSRLDDFIEKSIALKTAVPRINFLLKKQKMFKYKDTDPVNGRKELPDNKVPHIGDVIDDYVILDSLGWGKACIVYRVVETSTNKVFALKLLTRYALDSKRTVEKFREEIEIMSKISHPNVIHFYKMGEFENCPYILMDFINGVNLEEYMICIGRPDIYTIFKMAKEIALALKSIHDAGIIHGDVKLKNIMYSTNDNKSILTDFGISQFSYQIKNHKNTGYLSGTPNYMAPELFARGSSNIKSDIYAYGITLYQFITSIPPFSAKRCIELSQKHLGERPQPISLVRPDIPAELEHLVVDWCMAKIPSRRPDSIKEVYDKLCTIEKDLYKAQKKKYTLLIVDDEENILNSIKRLLRKEKYNIITALNGSEALDIIKKQKIELLIADYSMPGMTGIDLAVEMSKTSPDTSCIVLSGCSEIDTVINAVDAGYVNRFVSKPWNDEDLKLSVRLALERRELEIQNQFLKSMT